MCGGGGIAKMTKDIYEKNKKDYGELPSLEMGDKVKRKSSSEGMKDVKEPADSAARSLLMPFMK
tara:strand:+ start:231 stop:422 length:192 start_codon:yes stop_codon:yes gene_type:complete